MKLIFLDIDGTLTVPGENEPPESALEAIAAAREKGHKVFLCSGRNWAMLKPLLRYPFDGVVASGGGYVRVGDEVIFSKVMPREVLENVLGILRRSGVVCTIEAENGTWSDEDMGALLSETEGGNSEIKRWKKAISENLGILPMSQYDGSPIYKIIVICRRRSQLDEAEKYLEDDYRLVLQEMPELGCLNGEIIDSTFDKGTGIRKMCEWFDVPIEDTVGFGDSVNDLEMLETAGTSVCMENGSEICRKCADIICPAVDKDGLAEGFRMAGII